jgi:hypothetical protein
MKIKVDQERINQAAIVKAERLMHLQCCWQMLGNKKKLRRRLSKNSNTISVLS